MTCEEMLTRISSKELVQWQALYEIELEESEHGEKKNAMLNSIK